ncbi:hypothetical protein [Halioxenophilus aromaticivorans]|jgi:hypothetical protein|uniref:Nucleoside recognition protein n=1 Tax=Halioxenophilus aromaticivorans TaxID=1306992 RepID=A0AAV3U736_9ALTE|tara:strand:- start:2551 stop:3516 length:966 start_codon:yes stop_codon:yes gene_type:complete
MHTKGVVNFFTELGVEIFNVSYSLFKIMIPVIIIVKILELLGATEYLGLILSPIMNLVALPEEMGIVWATTILSNIYSGIVVLASLDASSSLTVAEITVLSSMMLLAHNIPVEGMIARKAGVSWPVVLTVRIVGGIVFGFIVSLVYQNFESYDVIVELPLLANNDSSFNIKSWALDQLKNILIIQGVIIILLFALKILKAIGIERILTLMLSPILRLVGIGRQATTLTIIGVTLGLAYGGGMLINESKKGNISSKDVFSSIVMLCMLHALIEDTLILLWIGADINGILWGRIVFALLVTIALSQVIRYIPDSTFEKHLFGR